MSASKSRRVLRSLGAVILGFSVTFVLSVATDAILHATGVFPPMDVRMSDGLFGLAAVYRAAYTVAGGYTTARFAPSEPMVHAWVLAAIGFTMGTLGVFASLSAPELGPLWYAATIPLSAVPCIWLGAQLRLREIRKPASP